MPGIKFWFLKSTEFSFNWPEQIFLPYGSVTVYRENVMCGSGDICRLPLVGLGKIDRFCES